MKKKNKYQILDNFAIIYIDSKKYGLKEVLVDKDDLYKIINFKWGVFLTPTNNSLYARTIYKNKDVRMHRLITDCPDELMVDHINKNTLDNRRKNLRVCTNSENQQNKNIYKNNKSGVAGISWHRLTNKWQVGIRAYNKQVYLGEYEDIENAKQARKNAEKIYFKPIKSMEAIV